LVIIDNFDLRDVVMGKIQRSVAAKPIM